MRCIAAATRQGTAHCADMYAPRPSDPESLTNARNQILSIIAKWVQ